MKRFVAIAFLIVSILSMKAQTDTIVSFVNIYPGNEIYELEGHSALRINMGSYGDYAVSYGQFDFNAPNFVYRFVKGETDYMVGLIPWQYFQYAYELDGRRMVEHIIDMTPEQKSRLISLVKENLQPENVTYRYNYVKDNCATRPLHMVELAMGDSITLAETEWDKAPTTFRKVMSYYHNNYPWYQFGIDLCLGPGIDYELSRRELAFAPALLDEQIADATIAGKPLVTKSNTLIDVTANNAIADKTHWLLSPIFVCSIVFLLLYIVTYSDQRRKKVTKWVDAMLYGLFGIEGLILTFLIFVSVHEATSPNWLYLWLNPLALIVPIFIWLKKCKIFVISYHLVNFVAVIALCAVWVMEIQSINQAFLPLIFGSLLRSASYIKLNYKRNAA